MKKNFGVVLFLLLSFLTVNAYAQNEKNTLENLLNRDSLTNGFCGLSESLSDSGIDFMLELTNVYQQNVSGGKSTSSRSGRYCGSYDFGWSLDMEKIAGISGADFYIEAQGSWSDGITDSAVGSIFPTNSDAAGYRSIDVTEYFWNQYLFDKKVYIRLGKIDLKGKLECHGRRVAFDGNQYANKKTGQFLNKGLYVNRSIPTPDNGYGMIALVNPVDGFYCAGGFADAQANEYEIGWRTAFEDEDYFLYMGEIGFMPDILINEDFLPGTYRFGFWYDSSEIDRYDDGNLDRSGPGYYLSCDQMVYREGELDDDQGLGLFARYSVNDKDYNKIKQYYSAGLSYKGLLPNRDSDVTGLGFVRGAISDFSDIGGLENNETAYELYYKIMAAGWLEITMDMQYITDPGADNSNDDALVLGSRFQVNF